MRRGENEDDLAISADRRVCGALVRGGTLRTLHVPLGRRDRNGHRVKFNAPLQLDVHTKPHAYALRAQGSLHILPTQGLMVE